MATSSFQQFEIRSSVVCFGEVWPVVYRVFSFEMWNPLKVSPGLRVIIDRKDKFALQTSEYSGELFKVIHRKDPVAVVVLAAIIRRTNIFFTKR